MSNLDNTDFEPSSAESETQEGGGVTALLALVPQLFENYKVLFAAKQEIIQTELKIACKSLLGIFLCAIVLLAICITLWIGVNTLIIYQIWNYYPSVWIVLTAIIILNLAIALAIVKSISSLSKQLSLKNTTSILSLKAK